MSEQTNAESLTDKFHHCEGELTGSARQNPTVNPTVEPERKPMPAAPPGTSILQCRAVCQEYTPRTVALFCQEL